MLPDECLRAVVALEDDAVAGDVANDALEVAIGEIDAHAFATGSVEPLLVGLDGSGAGGG
jgi:hypothetical protein